MSCPWREKKTGVIGANSWVYVIEASIVLLTYIQLSYIYHLLQVVTLLRVLICSI